MTRLSVEMLAADAPPPISTAGHAQLGIAVLVGIAVIVLLITKFKLHAFLALTIGSLALGAAAGRQPAVAEARPAARGASAPLPRALEADLLGRLHGAGALQLGITLWAQAVQIHLPLRRLQARFLVIGVA